MYSSIHRLRYGLYRSRRGWIFGVCRGLADYFNLSVFGIRAVALLALVLTGFWPVGALYLLAALLMRLEPRSAEMNEEKERPNNLRTRFESLDERLQHLETVVTGRAWDWDARLRGE